MLLCDNNYVVMKFFSKNLFLWWHELANLLCLLRLHISFLPIIKNFSLRQRLHFLLILLYGLHCLSILHLTLKGLFPFLSVQMYLPAWIVQSRSVSCGFGRMMCGFCIVS